MAAVSSSQPCRHTLADLWHCSQPTTWPIYSSFVLLETQPGARLADLPVGSLILFCPRGCHFCRDSGKLSSAVTIHFQPCLLLSTFPKYNRYFSLLVTPAVPAQGMHKVRLLIYFPRGSLKQQCNLEKWSTHEKESWEWNKGLSCGFPRGY